MTMNTNGWSQYEKLVLSRLDTLQTDVKETGEKLGILAIEVALMKQTIKEADGFEQRIALLEQNLVTSDTLKNDRRFLFRSALAILGSIIIPIAVAAIFYGGI